MVHFSVWCATKLSRKRWLPWKIKGCGALIYNRWSQSLSLIKNHYYERTIEHNIVNFVLWNSRVLKFY